MKRVVSHLGYLAFFVFSAYLAFRGVEDFGLLLLGKVTDAKIVNVSTESVRVGKRGRGTKYRAEYEFSAEDGKTYRGAGEPDGKTRPDPGQRMPIRYLSFRPSVSAPKDDVVLSGVMLTIAGGFLMLITLGAWRRKISADRAAPKKPGGSGREKGGGPGGGRGGGHGQRRTG
jgi:hypothetical protein